MNCLLRLFIALDVNGDGHVDFKELCCGISAACRGPTAERVKFCFKVFDKDQDGVLDRDELVGMVEILSLVAKESKMHSAAPQNRLLCLDRREQTPSDDGRANFGCVEVDAAYDKVLDGLQTRLGPDGCLSQEDFLIWGVDDNVLVSPLLELLFEVCHVSLGLKPHCRHHEYEIGKRFYLHSANTCQLSRCVVLVTGWLSREESRGYHVGQFWYLVASDWWQSWLGYTTAPRSSYDHCTCRPEQRLPVEEGIVCDESFTGSSLDYTPSHSNEFTSNSTDSMGDLLSRGGDT